MKDFDHRVIRVERPTLTVHRIFLDCGHDFLVRVVFLRPVVGDVRPCEVCRRLSLVPPDCKGMNWQLAEIRIRADIDRVPRAYSGIPTAKMDPSALARAMERSQHGEPTPATVLRLRTKDHPRARGNEQMTDRRAWIYSFPLEDGRTLQLEMGAEGRAIFERLFLGEMLENACGAHDDQEDRDADE